MKEGNTAGGDETGQNGPRWVGGTAGNGGGAGAGHVSRFTKGSAAVELATPHAFGRLASMTTN